jgi:hypothetical protein
VAFCRLIKTATGIVLHPWPSEDYWLYSLTIGRRNTTRNFGNTVNCGADDHSVEQFDAIYHFVPAPSFHKIFISSYILAGQITLVKQLIGFVPT